MQSVNGRRFNYRFQSGARQSPQFGREKFVFNAIENAQHIDCFAREQRIERICQQRLRAQIETQSGRKCAQQRGGRGIGSAPARAGARDYDVGRGKVSARRVSRRRPQPALTRDCAAFGRALRDGIEGARRRHKSRTLSAFRERNGARFDGQIARFAFDVGPIARDGQAAQFGGGCGFQALRRGKIFAQFIHS